MKLMSIAAAVALAAVAAARAEDNAAITGKATLDGDAPKMKKIKMDADPQCQAMHADKPATSEEVVVGGGGALKNVFVYVKSGLTGTYEAPKTPAMITQKGCTYTPHVFGIQVGQLLEIKNEDDTLHNIHALPTTNEEFNKGQPAGSPDIKRKFAKPEVMVKFKCDVHPWMSAYVGVVENPFYGTTGDDGTFALKGLPAGTYEVEAWHEKYGTQTQKVTVGAGESKAVEFKFKPAAE
jgi:plastocyanin